MHNGMRRDDYAHHSNGSSIMVELQSFEKDLQPHGREDRYQVVAQLFQIVGSALPHHFGLADLGKNVQHCAPFAGEGR